MPRTSTLPLDASLLVPQGPPMRLVTRLLAIEGGEAFAEGFFFADSPFAGKNGLINPLGLMELAAQACAAVQGYADTQNGSAPREGFLVGIKKFHVFSNAKAGEHLHIRVSQIAELDGFVLAEAVVSRKAGGESPLASLRLKAYCPPEGPHAPA